MFQLEPIKRFFRASCDEIIVEELNIGGTEKKIITKTTSKVDSRVNETRISHRIRFNISKNVGGDKERIFI